MTPSPQTYTLLLIVGLFLIGIETIIPGGILGIFGAIALVAAAIIGFSVFPGPWGFISAFMITLLAGATVVIWVKYFPRTIVGRILTLQEDTKAYKATSNRKELVGKEGTALTMLRPAGIAKIEGTRLDVVADGNYIEEGADVRVIDVEGNRVIVREVTAS